MPSNQSLIPTVITDVNGKITTVHRTQPKSSASSVVIPMPSVDSRNLLMSTTANQMRHMCSSAMGMRDTKLSAYIDSMSYVSSETIEVIGAHLKSYADPATAAHAATWLRLGTDEMRLRNALVAIDTLGENSDLSRTEIMAIACGASESVSAPPGFVGATDETMMKAKALMKVTSFIYMEMPSDDADAILSESTEVEGLECIKITSPELRGLVVGYAERADDIIGYINERGAADPDTLRRYLEDGSALADGIL
jgi:hypothetical protein